MFSLFSSNYFCEIWRNLLLVQRCQTHSAKKVPCSQLAGQCGTVTNLIGTAWKWQTEDLPTYPPSWAPPLQRLHSAKGTSDKSSGFWLSIPSNVSCCFETWLTTQIWLPLWIIWPHLINKFHTIKYGNLSLFQGNFRRVWVHLHMRIWIIQTASYVVEIRVLCCEPFNERSV